MGLAILTPDLDCTERNLGKVTVINDTKASSIDIVGETEVFDSARFSINYTPSNAGLRGVTWSIVEGSGYATISDEGVVTAKASAARSNVTIKAVYVHDTSVTATKSIVVSAENPLADIMRDYPFISANSMEVLAQEYDTAADDGHTIVDSFTGREQIAVFCEMSLPSFSTLNKRRYLFFAESAVGPFVKPDDVSLNITNSIVLQSDVRGATIKLMMYWHINSISNLQFLESYIGTGKVSEYTCNYPTAVKSMKQSGDNYAFNGIKYSRFIVFAK